MIKEIRCTFLVLFWVTHKKLIHLHDLHESNYYEHLVWEIYIAELQGGGGKNYIDNHLTTKRNYHAWAYVDF